MKIMRQRMPGFKRPQPKSSPDWYDMYEDWALIEASFAAQYNIRLRAEEDMSWGEFGTLLAGLMPETPLGQVISIRSESDKDTIKSFSPAQLKMHNDWKSRIAKVAFVDKVDAAQQINAFQEMMKQAFS